MAVLHRYLSRKMMCRLRDICGVRAERLHKALVVNAPPFFNLLWRIVQPLIPASTKERLFVLRNMKVCPSPPYVGTCGRCGLQPAVAPCAISH